MRYSTAKGDQVKVVDVQSQIYIISFFPGKLWQLGSQAVTFNFLKIIEKVFNHMITLYLCKEE